MYFILPKVTGHYQLSIFPLFVIGSTNNGEDLFQGVLVLRTYSPLPDCIRSNSDGGRPHSEKSLIGRLLL